MIEWSERWPNFAMEEVLSPRGQYKLHHNGILLVQPHALDFLQNFRNFIGKPFYINGLKTGSLNRGYRDCEENKRAGGSPHSYHMQGLAFDVTVEGVKSEKLYKAAIDYGWKGVGLYDTFVHIDLRPSLSNRTYTWDARVRG